MKWTHGLVGRTGLLITVLSMVLVTMVLAACGDEPAPAATVAPGTNKTIGSILPLGTPAPVTTSVATTPATTLIATAAPTTVASTTATPTPAAPTTIAPTTVAPTTAASVEGKGGQELVGQLLALKVEGGSSKTEVEVRISRVELVSSTKRATPTKDTYLLAFYEAVNVGTQAINNGNIYGAMFLSDAQGNIYKHPDNDGTVLGNLAEQDAAKYPLPNLTTSIVQPGAIFKSYALYDVPVSGPGLRVVPAYDFNKSARTPKDSDFAPTAAGPDSGAGQELVGQLIAADGRDAQLDIRVKGVERQTEIKGDAETIKAKGVFVIVQLEAANVGKYPADFLVLPVTLQDSQGRTFKGTTNLTKLLDALSKADPDKYRSYNYVQPGFSRPLVAVFEVAADVSGLKLMPDGTYATSKRQASADSFAKSGGGSDSGAGQELTGQSFTYNQFANKVTKTERLPQIKAGTRALTTDGVFVVIVYEATNNDSKEQYAHDPILKDSQGRYFVATHILSFGFLSDLDKQYPDNNKPVAVGQKATRYAYYELPKDAANLSLEGQ